MPESLEQACGACSSWALVAVIHGVFFPGLKIQHVRHPTHHLSSYLGCFRSQKNIHIQRMQFQDLLKPVARGKPKIRNEDKSWYVFGTVKAHPTNSPSLEDLWHLHPLWGIVGDNLSAELQVAWWNGGVTRLPCEEICFEEAWHLGWSS